jgi:ribosome biogenesis GTPase
MEGSGTPHGEPAGDRDDSAAPRGVILEVQRRSALVVGDDGAEYHCQYSPVIDLKSFFNFAVGDRVTYVRQSESQEPMITSVLPRRSQITRPGPRDRSADDLVLAANVDALLIVATVGQPEYNPRLVDRYLALAASFSIDAFICVNKVDLESTLPREAEYLRTIGYPVFPVSARAGIGLEALRSALQGLNAVFSGASGVGKSSLIKALVPGAAPRVAEVRKGEGKGRHTTTSSHLYAADGFRIIDTPGIRELGLRATRKELAPLWKDIAPLAEKCRFRDCIHSGEPDCAVVEAVRAGTLPDYRHDSYLRMLETLEK